MTPSRTAPSLVNHLAADWAPEALRADVRAGLAQSPKTLPPKWFYDSVGSDLFDQITRLPEYYPTRTEAQILRGAAAEIVESSGADTLIELGSGTSEKTRTILDAFHTAGGLDRFVAFDVDAGVLRTALAQLSDEYDGVELSGVCGDFEQHLGELPVIGRRLIIFLGSTIGNLTEAPRADFLAALAGTMRSGDTLLLGTDLVKDTARLVAAYDDAAGVTARFNRNVLSVLNRELSADFDLTRFEHVARWNPDHERMEMRLKSVVAQQVQIKDIDVTAQFELGEEVLTEVSCKFRPEGIAAELAAAGLQRTRWWTDPAGDFGVSLAVKE